MSDDIKIPADGGISDGNDVFSRISEKIMPLSFYKAGGIHTGNLDSMRYMIKKESAEESDSLFVSAWPGPFTFEDTKDELKVSAKMPLSEEGLIQSARWLAETYEASKDYAKSLSLMDCDDRMKDAN